MPSRGPSILVVFGAVCLAACGGGGGGGTPPPPPAHQIAKSSGDSQVANVSSLVQLQVLVTDTGGHAVADVPVAWAAVGGGTVSAASSNSDALGIATITRTLPTNAATVTTTATKAGLVGSPVTFTSIAQVNGAYRIQKFANDSQTDTVLSTLGAPYRVHVLDYQNNNVASYTVNWSVGGGGSVGSPTSNTDGSGIAQIFRTFGGTAGTQTASASVPGLIGSPITFTGTATHGQATTFAINNQSDTTGVVNTTLSYGVKATDGHGNPVSGVAVAWAVVAGGGSNNPTSNSTAVNGVAITTHTLGPSAGPDTVTATSTPGLTGPVTFAARITTAPLTASVTVGPGIVFAPDSVTIAIGGTVTWTWAVGSISHSVQWETAPGTLPTSSLTMTTGSYGHMFTQAGTYTYDCAVHGSAMSGIVVVQ